MKNIVIILFVLLIIICFGCESKQTKEKEPEKVTDTIIVHDFNSLEPLLYSNSEKIYIVNFWAMWCAPCVKELPIFQEYQKQNPDIELLFISLDFPKDIETKLKPFLKEKGIISKVVILDDAASNIWIDKIDPNWSGALPFTIIFNNNSRSFHEREFENYKDLDNEVRKTFK